MEIIDFNLSHGDGKKAAPTPQDVLETDLKGGERHPFPWAAQQLTAGDDDVFTDEILGGS